MAGFDIAYHAALAAARLAGVFRPGWRAKVADALQNRAGDVAPRAGQQPCLLLHAVSVGEINAARALVAELLDQKPDLHLAVTSTTLTGIDRARQLYASEPRITVTRFPLDFSASVRRLLDNLRPNAVLLMELEVWPNFIRECSERQIPVLVGNGRMTERSYRAYRCVRPFVRPTFARLTHVLAQERDYARRFTALGTPAECVEVAGTMKFDSAEVAERVEGDGELAAAVGLAPRALGGEEGVIVAGSTGPGEEERVLEAYEGVLERHAGARLVIVPRKPERFDEVARLIAGRFRVLRRSTGDVQGPEGTDRPVVVLGDTMGELRRFYSMADVVFVGRTLLDLGEKQHGSDMIEPAALGKPVAVGPWWGNFAEPMRQFLAAEAIREVADAAALGELFRDWLSDPPAAAAIGRRARQVIVRNQGTSARHVEVILQVLEGERGT